MRAVVQRVSEARVTVNGETVGAISRGLLVLLAVAQKDGDADLRFLARKLLKLRIFPDESGRLNDSLDEVDGQLLVVSQFTLYGDCRKGNRPSYTRAATAEKAERFYLRLIEMLRGEGIRVEAGRFQAKMEVSLINDGPVTLIVDSDRSFF